MTARRNVFRPSIPGGKPVGRSCPTKSAETTSSRRSGVASNWTYLRKSALLSSIPIARLSHIGRAAAIATRIPNWPPDTSSLEGNTRRAIDFHEGDEIDEKALKTLIRAAVTLNKSKAQK